MLASGGPNASLGKAGSRISAVATGTGTLRCEHGPRNLSERGRLVRRLVRGFGCERTRRRRPRSNALLRTRMSARRLGPGGGLALGRVEDRRDDAVGHGFETERLHRIGGAALR